MNYIENQDKNMTVEIRPIIKSKYQNYVKSGSHKILLGLGSTQKIKLGELANKRLNKINNEFEIPN